jgi:hypothetical protein
MVPPPLLLLVLGAFLPSELRACWSAKLLLLLALVLLLAGGNSQRTFLPVLTQVLVVQPPLLGMVACRLQLVLHLAAKLLSLSLLLRMLVMVEGPSSPDASWWLLCSGPVCDARGMLE